MSDELPAEPPSYICTECGCRVYVIEPTEPKVCGYCQTKPGWYNKPEYQREETKDEHTGST